MEKLKNLLMNSNFKILSKCQKVIEYYNRLLVNFPGKETVLKQNIERAMYDMVECLYAYNINQTERIKEKYLKDFIVKLSMIDFYSNISFDKRIISQRQLEILGRNLLEIKKMSYAIMKNMNHAQYGL